MRRLVEGRGFAEDDARARIARQATREQRLASASVVVDNSGPVDDLGPQVDRVWAWVESLPQLPAAAVEAGVGRRADGVDRRD